MPQAKISPERELLATARTVASLQLQRRRLRATLRKIEHDLKLERKHLRALATVDRELSPNIIPSKTMPGFGLKRS